MPAENKAIVAAMLELEASLEEAGWDQLASPFLLVTDPDDPFGTAVTWVFLPVDMRYWMQLSRPYLVLDALAEAKPPIPPRYAVQAVGIHHEGWMLKAHKDDVARTDQIDAAARDRVIYKDPERTEIRIAGAVDRNGRAYAVLRPRGADPEILGSDGGPVFMDCAVLDSIRKYASVVFGQ